MLVKDVIPKIASKELSIKQLAEKYGKSDRTVQSKIKDLGYQWNAKDMQYEFVGEGPEPLEESFDDLFNSKRLAKEKQNASKGKAKETKVTASASTNTSTSASIGKENTLDAIDLLLRQEKQSKRERTYRGFYFDPDVLAIIDQASNKSELVNQALRKVFKDKGLLS